MHSHIKFLKVGHLTLFLESDLLELFMFLYHLYFNESQLRTWSSHHWEFVKVFQEGWSLTGCATVV